MPALPPLLPRWLAATAARLPDAPAVAHGGTTLAYRDLDDRAGRLATVLAGRGAGPGTLVAVAVPPSTDLVAAVLAVLRTGAGYVPVAVDDPADRVGHVLADSGAVLVVTGPDGERGLRVGTPSVEAELADAPVAPWSDVGPDDIAYVVYTSGSTGKPKGVAVGHGALAAYLRFAVGAYPGLAGRALLHSSVSFDMAVTSLFGPLIAGGSLEVLSLLDQVDRGTPPPSFRRPTFLKVTPSHLALLRLLPEEFSPTGELVIGGEALTGRLLDRWRAEHPGVTVVNEYGPTEAAVGCCAHFMPPGAPVEPGAVPIGHAVEGTQLFLLDPDGAAVPDGTPGELHIAGSQLAVGYLGRPDLTADRFVTLPSGRAYRTGDLARRRPDGALEFLGRTDDQVKVNGHRVELGEVEAALAAVAGVTGVAVLPEGEVGERRLLAYVAGGVDAGALRAAAEAALPKYMVPSVFTVLAALPLTANGKVDRARLPRPERAAAEAGTAEEDLLRELVREVTGADAIGVDDDFMAIGGTSIAAAQLVGRARRAGFTFGLMDVLRKRTVRAILAAS